jgi:two-component system nitrogen regulation sensor histidine kinase NtrY
MPPVPALHALLRDYRGDSRSIGADVADRRPGRKAILPISGLVPGGRRCFRPFFGEKGDCAGFSSIIGTPGCIPMSELSSFLKPPKRNGSRTRRYIVASIAFLALSLAATQIFLNITSVGSPRFIRMTFLLWTITFLVVLALLILATVLGRNLIKLYFERKSGELGSGFKTKMVRTFIALSLLPALLLFLLAYTLIGSSLEKWFLKPPAQMIENSRQLAQEYYGEMGKQAEYFALNIASAIASADDLRPESKPNLPRRLQEFSRIYALGSVRVYDNQARRVAESGPTQSTGQHQELLRSLIGRAILGKPDFRVQRIHPDDPLKEIAFAAAPIRDIRGGITGAVLTETVSNHSVKYRVDSVLEALDKYEQLQREKVALRFNALLMLVLSTLLITFAFSWFALYLAKRITVPIQALAQGAAAVATGDLSYRVECQAFDELGSLVASFNRMTIDLQENEKRIETAQRNLRQTNAENADRRRYIETILQTITTGVVSLDSNYCIRTMNRAAMQMLQAGDSVTEARLDEVLQPAAFETIRALLQKSSVLGTVMRNLELAFPGKTLQIAATVTPLVDNTGQRRGWVVVLDDMTELLRMEKMSAWQEVARRMAHEIKNPLTPIQLSAERILRRYRQITLDQPLDLSGSCQEQFQKFEKLLNECVQVIISEAGSLKNLVDEFSRFARLPEVRLEEADLNSVLESTLSLYGGRTQGISVQKEFDPGIPKVRLDPEQMKRVFINLFDNALEAMAQNPNKKVLLLRTSCQLQQGLVRIEIGDTGRGFPEEYQDSLFLPYFSTRKGGTGLGLAIVRQIVSDHSGSVRAEPNVPVGTRIIVDLPI